MKRPNVSSLFFFSSFLLFSSFFLFCARGGVWVPVGSATVSMSRIGVPFNRATFPSCYSQSAKICQLNNSPAFPAFLSSLSSLSTFPYLFTASSPSSPRHPFHTLSTRFAAIMYSPVLTGLKAQAYLPFSDAEGVRTLGRSVVVSMNTEER